jgi:hypothetical protein
MPVKVKKEGGGYKVSTPKMVHAKHTTLQKAMAQRRLLNAVEHGWTPGRRRGAAPKMPMMKKGMM